MWQRLPYQVSFNITSFFIKAHTLLLIQVCLPFSGGLTTFSSPPRVPSHSPVHNNAVVTLQSYIFASFFPSKNSLSFKLGQGSYALSGQQGTWVFSEGENIHLHYICLQGHSAQKPERTALIQVFLSPWLSVTAKGICIRVPVAHVPSIRDTISFCILPPFSRLFYSASSLPLHPQNKIFSALVFKSNIFMVDGLPTTVRFPQLSLKNCQSLSSSNDRWLGAVKSSKFFP